MSTCPHCGHELPEDDPLDIEVHAARRRDPKASKKAVKNRAIRWKGGRRRALQIHAMFGEKGLNDWEAMQLAYEKFPMALPLGKCEWKRVGELRTEFDPPLIMPLLDEFGAHVHRPGEGDDLRGVYIISDTGIRIWKKLRAQWIANKKEKYGRRDD